MTPSDAVAEIKECLDENLGPGNYRIRILLREYERLQTQRDELRDISGCPPHSTLEAWLATLFATLDESHTLYGEIQRLTAELAMLHPRVLKLARAGKRFIVIGEHEPYFMHSYAMIRDQEMKQGTWTEEDRVEYAAAQLSAKESRNENL